MATADSSTNLRRDNTTDGVNASIETLPASTPSTLGYDESTFVENKWGYRIANSSINPSLITTNYFPFASGSTILENTTSTNEDKATVSFASKINYNLPAGSYATELIMNATANPIVYDIEYWDLLGISSTDPTKYNDAGLTWNNPTTGTAKEASYTKIGTQASTTDPSSFVAIDPTYTAGTAPTRHTYTFAGWCLDTTNPTNRAVNNTVTADQDSNNGNKVTAYHNPSTQCNGTVYQTGDQLGLEPGITNNIKLYAIWTPTTFQDAGVNTNDTMQTMTAAKCEAITPNQFTTMTDSRDNGANTYTIIKLLDGNCWMADNLNFDAYTYKNVISTSNTHITGTVGSTALAKFNGTNTSYSTSDRYATSSINGNSTYASGGNWTALYSYSDPLINRSGTCQHNILICLYPYQKGTYNGVTYTGNYDYNTTISLYGDPTISELATTTYDYGPGNYKIGTYYNPCAATLGSYCYGDGSTSSGAPSGNATDADICPAGWKLPAGGTSGDFQNLYDKIAGTSATTGITTTPSSATSLLSLQAMLSTPFSGFYGEGYSPYTAGRQGIFGIFLSSSEGAASHLMYTMSADGVTLATTNTNNRLRGISVRCIAQN